MRPRKEFERDIGSRLLNRFARQFANPFLALVETERTNGAEALAMLHIPTASAKPFPTSWATSSNMARSTSLSGR